MWINISKQRWKSTKTRISSFDWDNKFMRLREIGVDPITATSIINKHYVCYGEDEDEY